MQNGSPVLCRPQNWKQGSRETTVFLWQSSSGAQGTPHAAGTAREKPVRAPTARTRPCPRRCSSPRRPSHRPTSTCSLGAPYCPSLKTVLAVLGGQRPVQLLNDTAGGQRSVDCGGMRRARGRGKLSSEGRVSILPARVLKEHNLAWGVRTKGEPKSVGSEEEPPRPRSRGAERTQAPGQGSPAMPVQLGLH